MSGTPDLLRQAIGATEEKLHVLNHRWNPLSLAYEVETVTSGGTGSDVNITNAALPITAAALPLPLGAATAAKQDALLAELALKADLTETQPVSAASLPLPNGAATSANQTTELASLSSIDTKLTSVAKDGTDISAPTAMPAGGVGIRGWLSAIWTKLNASIAVTGTFWQATQPVSIATNTPDVTDRAGRLVGVVSGSGNFASTAAASAQADGHSVTLGTKADAVWDGAAASASGMSYWRYLGTKLEAVRVLLAATLTIAGAVSLGIATGKTNIGKPGALASSATTANQVIVTYTVTAAKTLYLQGWDAMARLTTFAATATLFGVVSLRIGGTVFATWDLAGAGVDKTFDLLFPEPLPIAAGVVVDIVCTPAAATAMAWKGNLKGYEK